jgi:HAD superfamily hydrolase (TIGR01509 family)
VAVLLAKLRAQSVQAAIWTGRDRTSADWLLREHGWEDYFSTVVCGDDLPTHKPDPEGLREIMRRLGVGPKETLFVGDADVDVLGGVACGVDTILIHNDRTIEAHISSQSWRIVASPVEAFAAVLKRLGRLE